MRYGWMIALAGLCLFLFPGAVFAGEQRREDGPMPASKRECSSCHRIVTGNQPGPLKQPLPALCLSCHTAHQSLANHPTGVIPQNPAPGLPLDQGRLTCTTCHDPHRNRFGALLRLPQTELCVVCHRL